MIIVDNLSNSSTIILNKIEKLSQDEDLIKNSMYFYNIDVSKESPLFESIFMIHNITYVIHMAAHKSVSESIEKPVLYYKNNIDGLLCLLKYMNNYKITNLIFSSSATVYGNSNPLLMKIAQLE